jgi:cytochrome c
MRSIVSASVVALAAVIGLATVPAHADGDADAGKKVFRKCQACHTAGAGEPHKVGPNLHGVVGRAAGTADGYTRYSDALKESGVTWDEASLTKYLHNPKEFIPGNQMAFPGLRKDADVENAIAYLKSMSE